MSYLFVNQLMELTQKKVCRGYLEHVWKHKFDWDEEKTKAWLADNIDQLSEHERIWKDGRSERMNIIKRYLYNDTTSAEIKPYDSADSTSGVRYIEGKVVTTKGEKYILQKEGQEWDGGSRGKVKTKGKRGKGFI